MSAMNTRTFGKTGRDVSEVGLGCWQLGGTEWGEVSDQAAMGILDAAVASGVTFSDTADIYGRGRSETLIGRFLAECRLRDRIFIATKLGRHRGYPDDYSLDLLRSCTEDSLKRLGVEAIDLTQLHCVPPQWLERGDIFGWLETLQAEGKIKAWGASVESMGEALVCLEHPGLASLQIIFNIFRQKPIEMLFDDALEKNVALIVRLPLASGLLAGKFTRKTTFQEKDHRNFNRDGDYFNVGETFAGLPFAKGVELADALKPYAAAYAEEIDQPEVTMAMWSQRWILDYEAVSVVIPGGTKAKQIRDNAAASDLPPLGDAVHEELRMFYVNNVKEHIRGVY